MPCAETLYFVPDPDIGCMESLENAVTGDDVRSPAIRPPQSTGLVTPRRLLVAAAHNSL